METAFLHVLSLRDALNKTISYIQKHPYKQNSEINVHITLMKSYILLPMIFNYFSSFGT